jgi:hypothetical protein
LGIDILAIKIIQSIIRWVYLRDMNRLAAGDALFGKAAATIFKILPYHLKYLHEKTVPVHPAVACIAGIGPEETLRRQPAGEKDIAE